MKRILFSLACMLLVALSVSAVPAKRQWVTVSQSDGTQIQLMLVGDEHFHCYLTTDNVPVMEVNGSYYYADTQGDELVSTQVMAHEKALRTAEEQAMLDRQCSASRLNDIRNLAPSLQQRRAFGEPTVYEGTKKGLVILVSFSDLDFASDDPVSVWGNILNQEGYTNANGAIGSVHDYFHSMSGGMFDLNFDIAGPYQAPKSVTYYGENGNKGDRYERITEFIRFAITKANNDVNFADYDWDGDGEVEQVYVLYAGYGEASGAPSYTIWPHESKLGWYGQQMFFDGVTINTYATGEELSGTEGTNLSGLGTFCHEFSHCLGLPDFYDTITNSEGDGQYAMGSWDIMDQGSYNSDGWVPPSYTGYEKNFCGWLQYRELTEPCKVTKLQPITNGGATYVIYNPANRNEYYFMENRRKVGWDKGLWGQGLLICHVNYVANRWYNNTVNRTGAGNPLMTVACADNEGEYFYSEAGDPWPYNPSGQAANDTFSDTSTPAARLYTKNTDNTYYLHCKVYVKRQGGVINFVYNDGTVEYDDLVDGIVQIDAEKEDLTGMPATIYDTKGIQVMKTNAFTGEEQLPRGMYVIKADNGQIKKVFVR